MYVEVLKGISPVLPVLLMMIVMSAVYMRVFKKCNKYAGMMNLIGTMAFFGIFVMFSFMGAAMVGLPISIGTLMMFVVLVVMNIQTLRCKV